MNEYWIDRIAVLLAILFALSWLAFHMRHKARKKKEPNSHIGACGSPCEGCPYGDNCGGKR